MALERLRAQAPAAVDLHALSPPQASDGPHALNLIHFDVVKEAAIVERITEVAVIVSLFTAGLKLRVPLRDPLWRLPVVLASWSVALTVGLIALVGVVALELPLGAAILLGAVLAPTDPVLASDVQVSGPRDQDRLRFTLTGEAAFNDGTAFPFVMLGLGLLGLHETGEGGWRWLAVDVLWAIPGGLLIGALLGTGTGRVILFLRREHKEAVGLDDFLALGLIALSYGTALLVHTYGFLPSSRRDSLCGRSKCRRSVRKAPDEVVAAAAAEGRGEEIATHLRRLGVHDAGGARLPRAIGADRRSRGVLLIGVMIFSVTAIPSGRALVRAVAVLVIRPVAAALG